MLRCSLTLTSIPSSRLTSCRLAVMALGADRGFDVAEVRGDAHELL